MSDDSDLTSGAALDPDEERVRRLLAGARHDAPVPAEVAARLDAALERLVDERRADARRESARASRLADAREAADEVAARRRRKRWTTALVAAAAAVVVGVGAPQLGSSLNAGGNDSGEASSADEDVADSAAGGADGREFAESGPGGDAAAEEELAPGAPTGSTLLALPSVKGSTFKRDALDARSRAVADGSGVPAEARTLVCGDVPTTAEQVVRVQYVDRAGEQAGYLVFEPASAPGRQRVTLYVCPGGVPLRSGEVPGP